MSPKYDLPNGVGRSSSTFLRTLLVWGLPLLAWAGLIVGWLLFSSGGNGATKEAETTPPASNAEASKPEAPAQPSSTSASASEPSEKSSPEKSTAKASPKPTVCPPAVYDFAGAVSHIGLPKESGCATGILVDPATRRVLWAKLAEKPVPIASMTKMMTLLLAEEAIAEGRIARTAVIPVSVEAYKIGGSQVWLDPKESFPLGELLKAVAIKSANDAAYLVGETLGRGDIAAFVTRMNARARELGMTHTEFYDAHGLGDAQKRNNTASAHDMVLLGERLLAYPEVMRLASTRMDSFRDGKLMLKNHNNLVFQRVKGVDGLKTGYTNASGYCITFSCKRGDRRLLGCVTGFKSARDRDTFCKALLDWGYSK